MERLTRATGTSSKFQIDAEQIEINGQVCSGPAIDRLACFENVYVTLLDRQEKIAAELEHLRSIGRQNTVSFKQLLAEKLMNQTILILFKSHGLE